MQRPTDSCLRPPRAKGSGSIVRPTRTPGSGSTNELRDVGRWSSAPKADTRATDAARARGQVEALALAAVDQRRGEIESILRDAGSRGASWWTLCQDMVAPAARLTGEWWREDGCTFLEVTMATAELHRAVRRVGEQTRVRAPSIGRTILLSAAPGAQHTLGLLLVADRMKRLGWRVEIGWPFRPPKTAMDRAVDVVGLSVSGSRDFGWASDWTEKIKERFPDVGLLFGGSGAAELEETTGLRNEGEAYLAVRTAISGA